ncbi:MAG: PseG/SpsG family protein [Nitrosarchaeum sp.]
MRILFRTSGGRTPKEQLGLGHIFRCINLASMFEKSSLYFLIEDFGGVKKLLTERKFRNISLLKKNIDLKFDVKKTIDFIKRNNIDIAVIDRYLLNPEYAKQINKYVKTVIITDLDNIQYEADLVISGYIGYKNQDKTNSFGTRCLLGPKFQILDKRFSKIKKRSRSKYGLLATFGGFDDKNISELFLETISKYLNTIKTKIILGPSSKKSKKIMQIAKKFPKQLDIVQETKDMPKEMSNTKYGISAGGLTSYEFASMRIPFVIICQVPHQLKTAKIWEKKGIAINLGLIDRKTPKKIDSFLKKIEGQRISLKKIRHVDMDANGSMRIKREILRLYRLPKISKVTLD